MKKIKLMASFTMSIASLLSIAAEAAIPGLYIGGQMGHGHAYIDRPNKLNYVDEERKDFYDSDEGGFSGGLFVGYNFNRYFGIEGGYTQFAKNTYRITHSAYSYNFNASVQHNVEANFKTDAWSLVGKGYLPLDTLGYNGLANVDLYAKLGFAYVTQQIDINQSFYQVDSMGHEMHASRHDSSRVNEWRPTFGIGIGYSFNKNLIMDVSWTQTLGKGDLNHSSSFEDFTPRANLFAVGLAYSFG